MSVGLRTVCMAATVVFCAGGAAEGKVTFSLDYSLDPVGGIFDTSTVDGQQARAAVQRAAQVLSDRLLDNLTAITPGGGNTWSPRVVNPATGVLVTPGITSVAANEIRVYVGSQSLGVTPEVGVAYAGTAAAGGTQAFIDNAASRGQAGALATPKTDYGPWGGSVSFDWDTNWYVGLTVGGLTPNKMDLFTVAEHELVHLLGFSASQPSYANLAPGSTFNGASAKAVNGGVAPTVTGSHWLNMTSRVGAGGVVQTALMDAGLPSGVRRRLTLLDWAALDDLGWSLATPGDANANGVVSFADYQALERGFGRPDATWATGDFNEDGAVNFADFMILYNNMGLRADGTLAPTAEADRAALATLAPVFGGEVPEPGGVAIVLGLGWVVMHRRRR
jgi:hypothetical protein